MGIRQDPQTLEKESERKSRREREREKGGVGIEATKNIYSGNI